MLHRLKMLMWHIRARFIFWKFRKKFFADYVLWMIDMHRKPGLLRHYINYKKIMDAYSGGDNPPWWKT